MAKETKNDLVMLSLGWYAKFVLPVDAATQIVSTLVKSGAVRVEHDHMDNRSIHRPTNPDFGVESLKDVFLADCPVDDERRKEYLAWLKTKIDIIGKGYQLESYAEYLKAQEGAS